jgi:tRNA-2-methylthio-N6-dimethylallyladenosine synthase
MSGRARDNRLVHVAVGEDPALRPRPGDIADVIITRAAPHHLTADASGQDSAVITLRRTRGGDAWETRKNAEVDHGPAPVSLGMPKIGAPEPLPVVESSCQVN